MVLSDHLDTSQVHKVCHAAGSGGTVTSVTSEMDSMSTPTLTPAPDALRRRWSSRVAILTILITSCSLTAVLWFAFRAPPTTFLTTKVVFPVGVPDHAAPSGLGPPGAGALPGFTLDYVTDFLGTSIPAGWNVFTGIPGGDPGGQFASSHVVVSGGLLHLNVWKDPSFQNRWVTGGLCQCGLTSTYRAYFVRSRITGGGANQVELLWPESNIWPPEIDFNETLGSKLSTVATIHFGVTNRIDQRYLSIDMSTWHTWGIVWTKSHLIFTVDGREWASTTAAGEIPAVPMRLDLEQRTMCSVGSQCPQKPVSMLVDWVAEYSPD